MEGGEDLDEWLVLYNPLVLSEDRWVIVTVSGLGGPARSSFWKILVAPGSAGSSFRGKERSFTLSVTNHTLVVAADLLLTQKSAGHHNLRKRTSATMCVPRKSLLP